MPFKQMFVSLFLKFIWNLVVNLLPVNDGSLETVLANPVELLGILEIKSTKS